jgi:thiol-disulfide isomerase/thioredoxin
MEIKSLMKNSLKLRSLALIYFLFLAAGLNAQLPISISPDHYLQDKREGIAPLPLFLPGKDHSLLPPGQKHPKLKLPPSTLQCGFTFASCVTPANYAFNGQTPIYFTNIGAPGMSVYVDRNYNYNYTDDGAPLKPGASGVVTVFISSPKDPQIIAGSTYTLLSGKMNISNFPIELFSNNLYYEGVELIDVNYWMAVEQLWIKGTNVVCDGDSLCVVFFDRNLDGNYTGPQDMIGLDDYGIDSAWTDKYHGMRIIEPGLLLAHNGKTFEIISDSASNSVQLKFRNDSPAFLKPGDQLPHFYLKFMNGDSADIYSKMQPGKFTFIDFWGTWCAACIQSIPQLQKLNAEKADSLVIISVNAHDNRDKAKKFTIEKNMPWLQAFSNPAAENILYAGDSFPYGILIDPNGKIIQFDVNAERLNSYMTGNKTGN